MRAAGWVLTGGQSSRMGTDKALLSFEGAALVTRIAVALQLAAHPVTLVGQPARYAHLPWPCLPDLRGGLGPLGGLETALAHTETELNLIVGCDMPLLPPTVLHLLLERAARTDANCVAVRDAAGKVHPLLAVYQARCLAPIRQALDEGRLKLTALLSELSSDLLEIDEAIPNLNTPEDWARWLNNR